MKMYSTEQSAREQMRYYQDEIGRLEDLKKIGWAAWNIEGLNYLIRKAQAKVADAQNVLKANGWEV